MLKKLTLLAVCILVFSSVYAGNREALAAFKHHNYQEAIKIFKQSAQEGDVAAAYNLGLIYQGGLGVPANYKKSIHYYTQAAIQKKTGAMLNLGAMYAQGDGVKANAKTAIHWFQQAIQNKKIIKPAYNIGIIYYYKGSGIKQNYAKAMHYFRMSAMAGDVESQYYLGLGYLKGQGVKQSNQEAYDWFSRAKLGGYAKAKQGLSQLYARLTPAQIEQLQEG
jgi:TPR repeat protein